jgi:hypothetical protein
MRDEKKLSAVTHLSGTAIMAMFISDRRADLGYREAFTSENTHVKIVNQVKRQSKGSMDVGRQCKSQSAIQECRETMSELLFERALRRGQFKLKN